MLACWPSTFRSIVNPAFYLVSRPSLTCLCRDVERDRLRACVQEWKWQASIYGVKCSEEQVSDTVKQIKCNKGVDSYGQSCQRFISFHFVIWWWDDRTRWSPDDSETPALSVLPAASIWVHPMSALKIHCCKFFISRLWSERQRRKR